MKPKNLKIVNNLKKVDWKNPVNILMYGAGGIALIYLLMWILQILFYVMIFGVLAYLGYIFIQKRKEKK